MSLSTKNAVIGSLVFLATALKRASVAMADLAFEHGDLCLCSRPRLREPRNRVVCPHKLRALKDFSRPVASSVPMRTHPPLLSLISTASNPETL